MSIYYVIFIICGTIFSTWTVAWCIGRCCFNKYGGGSGGGIDGGGGITAI